MPDPPRMQPGRVAAYSPSVDLVTIPVLAAFEDAEAYHSTLFHELAHSTGHPRRLNRPTLAEACPFGSTNYSKEELVAEMAAAFLCAHAGIANRTVDSSAS
jgi:antirestriction protein ArdC